MAWAALGHLALTTGSHAEAADHLRRVHRLHSEVLDAGDLWYQGDLLEALLAIGAVAEAGDVVAEVSAKADLSKSKWGSAVARRGLGCCTADPKISVSRPKNSLHSVRRSNKPAACSSSESVTGIMRHHACALRIFERVGAEPWAAQARRIAGPIAPTSSSLASLLTNDELRVAVAIARGRNQPRGRR